MDNDPNGVASPPLTLSRRFYKIFPALAVPNYRLFMAGQAVSLIGTWMQGPVLSWVVYDLTRSTKALGTVSFLGQLPMTLLVIAAGVVADRHSRQTLITITQSWLMLMALGLGIFASLGMLNIGWIYMFAVLTGIAQAFDTPARQAFMVEVAGREALGNAIALNSAMFNTARVIGPTIGTIILAAVGAAACFYINAASFLAFIAVLVAMKGLHYRPMSTGSKGFKDLVDGLRYVAGHGDILILLVLTATFSLFGVYYSTLLPAFTRELYMKEATAYGVLISCLGAGALVGALVMAATSTSMRQQRLTVFGLGLTCLSLLSLSLITNYYAACAVLVVYGYGMISFLVSGNILVQHLSDARYQGRTMGVRHFVFGGMWTFGSLIAGYLPKYLGLRGTVAAGAGVMVAVLIFTAPRVLKIDITALRTPPDGAAGDASKG